LVGTGIFIRRYLVEHGEGSPSDVFRELRKVRPKASYANTRRYFYILRELGLIEFSRLEKGRGLWMKRLYRLTRRGLELPEMAPEWMAPQVELYPATRWGGRRYPRAKAERVVVPGRKPEYSS